MVECNLETLISSLQNELEKCYIEWQSADLNETEKTNIKKLWEEQRQRVKEFQQKIYQWIAEAKCILEQQSIL